MIIKLPTISNLGSITVGDMQNVSKLSQESLDDRSFLIKLVANKLEDAGVSEADIENITNEEFLGILVKWLKDNNLSIDEVNPSFQNIVDTLKGEFSTFNSELSVEIHELNEQFLAYRGLSFENLGLALVPTLPPASVISEAMGLFHQEVMEEVKKFKGIMATLPSVTSLAPHISETMKLFHQQTAENAKALEEMRATWSIAVPKISVLSDTMISFHQQMAENAKALEEMRATWSITLPSASIISEAMELFHQRMAKNVERLKHIRTNLPQVIPPTSDILFQTIQEANRIAVVEHRQPTPPQIFYPSFQETDTQTKP